MATEGKKEYIVSIKSTTDDPNRPPITFKVQTQPEDPTAVLGGKRKSRKKGYLKKNKSKRHRRGHNKRSHKKSHSRKSRHHSRH